MLSNSEKTRLARMVSVMRGHGGIACAVAASKIDAVVNSFARELADGFLSSEVETAFQQLLRDWPSVMQEDEDTLRKRAAEEAARAPDPKKMSAQERLAHANRLKLKEIEATAANGAKLKSDRDLTKLTPAQRLELANKRKGENKPEPKALTPEQLKAMPATLRLSRANADAMRKAETDAKTANKHMSAAQRLQIADEAKRLGLEE